MRTWIIIVLIMLSLILSSCSDSAGNSIKIASPLQVCKTVQVPYDAIETYQVDMKYEHSGATSTTLHGLDVWAVGEVKVRNVDSETGAFSVEQTFSTLNRPSQSLKSTLYVMPGETKIFHEEFDISLGEDFKMTYVVMPAQKTLTRTVTKYRDEQQCN